MLEVDGENNDQAAPSANYGIPQYQSYFIFCKNLQWLGKSNSLLYRMGTHVDDVVYVGATGPAS